MPQGETFWNPYRWVPVDPNPPQREAPAYHHRLSDLLGRLYCTLTALTPFIIGSTNDPGRFIRSEKTKKPFIPATSLKGLIRSLVELVGNAAIPFGGGRADQNHTLDKAAYGDGPTWQLDIAARTFGYLKSGKVFAGLVRFSDAHPTHANAIEEMSPVKVVVGQPRPDEHKPFYTTKPKSNEIDLGLRKFYHHHVNCEKLVPSPAWIKQVREVRPLKPGATFEFRVDFENLREEELNLLLYCLVLEEEVTVTLRPEALGPGFQQEVTITGPLRHKLGGCKPQGGGSVHIQVVKMELYPNIAERYRGRQRAPQVWEGDDLKQELQRRTAPIVQRQDMTMQALRAMLIYSENDPRKNIRYPSYQWFEDSNNSTKQLKPTL